jgi:hypothetical protein
MRGRALREWVIIMSSLVTLVLLFMQLLVCEGVTTPSTATTTSLPPLMTGDCTVSTSTWAGGSATYYPTLATTSNLVLGQWQQSIYSTSSEYGTYYTFWTLGCQSSSLSCCPSAALSTTTDTVDGTIIFSIEPVTACPADYTTTIDQMYTTNSEGLVQTLVPTTLCCPSSWEIWPTMFPDNGGLHPCYQPGAPIAITQSPDRDPYSINVIGPDGKQTQIIPDYQVEATYPTLGGTEMLLGVRITRSYQLAKPGSGGKGRLGTGAIIGIAIPIACVFIGAGLLYWLYKSKQRKKEERRKMEESEKGPGMPELGEGLRHELEPGTKMATPSEIERRAAEVDIPQVCEERNVSELQNATLRSPWSAEPLHELSGKDIKEMDSNAPAAHEVVAEDWRIVP